MAINENIAQKKTTIKFSSKRPKRCDYMHPLFSFFSMTCGGKQMRRTQPKKITK